MDKLSISSTDCNGQHILFLSEAFVPEIKSSSTLLFELASSLVNDGYKVSVVTRSPCNYLADETSRVFVPEKETIEGIDVYRKKVPNFARNIPLIRGFEQFVIAFSLFFGAIQVKGFDLILVYLPPLPLGLAGSWLSMLRKKPIVVNLHDLYPQTVIDLGLLKNKLLIWISRLMEAFVYRHAKYFTVPFDGNKQYLMKFGIKKEIIEIVPNWADTELIKPSGKDNEFALKYGLKNKFVVSFAGSIGFAQGLEVVINAANLLKDKPEIQIVIVGDGVKKNDLVDLAKKLMLTNITFIPLQPLNEYPDVLHSSDIGLVILSQDLITPAIPGKLLSIMAAGIPVIASLPLEGEVPKMIEKYQCGICVEPGSPRALADMILRLYNDKDLMGKMGQAGRNAAITYFSRQIAASKYEAIFNDLSRKIIE